jgi:hypothetical protein
MSVHDRALLCLQTLKDSKERKHDRVVKAGASARDAALGLFRTKPLPVGPDSSTSGSVHSGSQLEYQEPSDAPDYSERIASGEMSYCCQC